MCGLNFYAANVIITVTQNSGLYVIVSNKNIFTLMIHYGRQISVLSVLTLSVAVLSRCVADKGKPGDPRGKVYAGSASCRQCHQAIYDSVLQTAHYNATAPANAKTVLGSFEAGHNNFAYEGGINVKMEKRDSGLYQVLYVDGKEELASRFDITFGVKNGQTCLYWYKNNTYQLPVSYYTSVKQWGTSPGFSIMLPDFSRLVGKNCFECHSSYVKGIEHTTGGTNSSFSAKEEREAMDKNTLVYGIDCERCHGPAAAHVSFQLDNPGNKTASYIISTGSLNGQQKLDRCAVCHAGNDKEKLKSRFLFKPGDLLTDYFKEGTGSTSMDVHGNQYGLLSQSKCFTGSTTLSCTSCHNPHTNASKSLSLYSQKCVSCHAEASNNFCTVKPPENVVLKNNCIDCHMPEQPSSVINFQLSGNAESHYQLFRTHQIGIYPAQEK